jgi:hypothetical protein
VDVLARPNCIALESGNPLGCSGHRAPSLLHPSRLDGHPAGYNSTVDRKALRAFASRDWQSAINSKAEYWSTRFRQDPLSTWHAAQGLLAYVRRLRPSFPSEAARDEDLHAHIALRSRLDRAAHAFARR